MKTHREKCCVAEFLRIYFVGPLFLESLYDAVISGNLRFVLICFILLYAIASDAIFCYAMNDLISPMCYAIIDKNFTLYLPYILSHIILYVMPYFYMLYFTLIIWKLCDIFSRLSVFLW